MGEQMQTDPQIIFRDVEASPAIHEKIDEEIRKLDRVYDRITSCRVTVERAHHHGRKGHEFRVAIDLELPGKHIVVNRKPGDVGAHEDLAVAVRDSFLAARRQLDELSRIRGGVHVKTHPEKHRGSVVRLMDADGFGFLRMLDGTEVFFRREGMAADDWTRLAEGTEVEFTLMDGEQGPYAVHLSLRS